ncbi:pyridoxal phosphate-dependent aminotransferase [Roseivirga sp.]|uniref:pyridoxal phosphate-dependent aminotransferase n=1 Tax=Roseivirga sp. TaxID=1964215 RepID=UPI003B52F508
MSSKRFKLLNIDYAPGQEGQPRREELKKLIIGDKLSGGLVNFSHGDIDSFQPIPDSEIEWLRGFVSGTSQAYTKYRGAEHILEMLAKSLTNFTESPIDHKKELIITPGTQGALFLAMAANISNHSKVAIVEPDYFAIRKTIHFLGAEPVPLSLNYLRKEGPELDLDKLEHLFKQGVNHFVFSNPNNPTGLIYSPETIKEIASLALKYNVSVIADQLYSRMIYSGEKFTHIRSMKSLPDNLITLMGPSKTESMSGFRIGVAFGTDQTIDKMERIQAIVSLRASGYSQAVLKSWFNEPIVWMKDRIKQHEIIRNELVSIFREEGLALAKPQGGCYLFIHLPPLIVDFNTFILLLRYQANVTVTSGAQFSPKAKNCIRLNFSQSRDNAISGAKRIVRMIKLYEISPKDQETSLRLSEEFQRRYKTQ